MKILGISASQRKWGNTDILIRHVLQGAAEEEAEIRFLRLTDFDVVQCKECMKCIFKDSDCIIEDDFSTVLGEIRESDAVVMGSPVHKLFAAGSIQMLIPRFFRQDCTGELSGKPGVALAVGGMAGWEGWALPQIVSLFLSLGMPLVDHFMGYGQGPGEIFYDTRACSRALETGRALARGERRYIGDSGSCPVCHCDLVFSGGDAEPRCMLCDLPGQWVPVGRERRFVPCSGAVPRWEGDKIRTHFKDLILPSEQKYRDRKKEIKKKIDALKSWAW